MRVVLNFLAEKSYAKLAVVAVLTITISLLLLSVLVTTYEWGNGILNKATPEQAQVCQSIKAQCNDAYGASGDPYLVLTCEWGKENSLNIKCDTQAAKSWGGIFTEGGRAGGLIFAILSSSFAAVICLSVAKFISTLKHTGWKRLSIVTGVIGSLAVLLILWDDYSNEELFFLWLGWSVAFFLAPAALNGLVGWVSNGFDSDNGMATVRESNVKALDPPSAPLEPKPATVKKQLEWTRATYWDRFFSRCIDLVVVYFVANFVLAFVPDIPSQGDWFFAITIVNLLVNVVVLCATFYFYEVLFLSKFGSTLGKMALGLRVENKNHEPILTRDEAKTRAKGFLRDGIFYMLFFPLIQVIAAFQAWKRRHSQQPWDEVCGTTVLQKSINPIRSIFFKLLALVLVATLLVLSQAMKIAKKEEIRQGANQSYMR